MNIRRNVLNLSNDDRKVLVEAFLRLKRNGRYDKFIREHVRAMDYATPASGEEKDAMRRNAAHRGPSFLSWHREYLRQFELALEVPLPYWDWTRDAEIPDPAKSELWSSELMGGDGSESDGWRVIDGPFAHAGGNWEIADDLFGPALTRRFASFPVEDAIVDTLPTKEDVALAKAESVYDSHPWDRGPNSRGFRNRLEGWVTKNIDSAVKTLGPQLHNRVHLWVGGSWEINGKNVVGSMVTEASPNDPVFFLHHCFVDKIWADWQAEQKLKDPAASPFYRPLSGGPFHHNIDDAMFPWDKITNRDVLEHQPLGYRYDTDLEPNFSLLAEKKRELERTMVATLTDLTSPFSAA